MKKTLIALAALAAMTGAAHAQSSVTLYGVADAYLGQTTTKTQVGTAPETSLSRNVVNGSGMSSSRWGFRGSEDLGGGLFAEFNLEGSYDMSTGAVATIAPQGNTLFGRAAFVGLRGKFGSVKAGRFSTSYSLFRSATNNVYDSVTFAAENPAWSAGIQDMQSRASNAVSYTSPDIAGFSGAVTYGFGENATATSSAESNASMYVQYAKGPLLVGYSHQRETQVAGGNFFGSSTGAPAAAVTSSDTRKFNMLGAVYTLGTAKLTGAYNVVSNNTRRDKEYALGVSLPFGAAALAAGYAHASSEGSGLPDLDGKSFSLLGTYNLSKRTTLYAGVISTEREAGTAAAAITTTKLLTSALGIRHGY